MKMLLPIVLVVSLIPPLSISTANAQSSDLLGLFFDESGEQASIATTEPYEVVPFHLVLLEPSHNEGIYAWECILEGRTGDGPAVIFGWQLAGDAFNGDEEPRFLVMLTTPLPPATAVVLASGEIFVPDTGTEILFFLHPFDPPSLQNPPDWGYPVTTPLYAYGEDLYQSLGWTSGCEAEPVARINDDGEDPIWSLGDLPEEILFGYVPAGETAIRNVHIHNTGEVALSGQLGISGDGFTYRYPYDPWYWTSDLQWLRIAPGQSEIVQVRLESTTDEAYEGALDLIVCGETTTIGLIKQPAFHSCTIEPAVLDFGVIDLYAPGPWEGQATITNEGTVPLEIVVDEDCLDFEVWSSCELIPPGDSCDFWVAFDPSELGVQECFVSINDGLCELLCVAVVVDGPSQCVITPPAWDFGLVWAGEPTQRTFEVWNIGGQQLEGQVTIPESCSGFTLVNGAEPFSLAHDETHSFTVEFDPVEWGPQVCNAFVSADCADVELLGIGLLTDESCWLYEYGDPPLVGRLDTPGEAIGVAVSDSHAYIADGESGLQVINITNHWNPQIIGSVDTPGYAGAVAISGNYAYVADGTSGLRVIDITVPTSPEHVTGLDTGYSADVAVAGDYAYVTGFGFLVIDISDPRNPWIAAEADTNAVYCTNELAVASGYAFAAVGLDPGSFLVLDITDPLNPQVANTVRYSSAEESSCNGVTVSGDYLYVTGSTQVNIGDPFRPIWVSTYLRRYNISTPENPESAGALTRQTGSGCFPGYYGGGGVAIAENHAYLTAGGTWGGRLEVLDISPGLSIVGEVDAAFSAEIAVGGVVYAVGGASGMYVIPQQCDDVLAIEDGSQPPESGEEIPHAGLQLAVYPNPFNPQTTISFSRVRDEKVSVAVYDLIGRRVTVLANRAFTVGSHTLTWNGCNAQGHAMPSGTYIVRLETESGVAARKVSLIR